jgi:hypothetical protein
VFFTLFLFFFSSPLLSVLPYFTFKKNLFLFNSNHLCLFFTFTTIKRHCFEVATPDEVFFMYADNEKEKDEWIGAIGRAIVKYSGSFQGSKNDDSSSDDSSDEEEDTSGVAKPKRR